MTIYTRNRAKVRIANTTLVASGGAFGTVIAATSGMAIGVTQFIATNQLDELSSVGFYAGDDRVTPDMNIGASGTLFLDLDGEQLELAIGSGLFAASNPALAVPNMQITIYYVLHDERTPISKSTARQASVQLIGDNNITRTPNIFVS